MDEIDTREARRGAGFSSEAARGAPVGSEPRRPRRRRLGNAFVRALLRSPAHRLLSGSLVLIRVRGRRTGTLRTFPVMYAREGDSLWVVCGEADRKSWWRNLREPAPVGLRLRGKEYRARGRAILGRREPAIATGGLAAWVRRFPKAGPRLGVGVTGGDPNRADLERVAAHSVVVELRLEGPAERQSGAG